MKIKTNDKVKVMSGKDAGKIAKVIQSFPKEGRVVVEGLNIMKKKLRSQKSGEKGQIIELAAPMAVSKVQLVCPKCEKPTRVGYRLEAGAKKRVCSKCGELID